MTMTVEHILSVSGGKDSTACGLWLREQGIPFRAVHFDTGWEHAATVAYVRDTLPGILGVPVEVARREPRRLDERREAWAAELEAMLGFRSPMVRWILSRGMFPSRVRRFCTQELKMFTARDVMREAHARGVLPLNVVGIRADESAARAKLEERELSTTLDCMVWRPLLRWSEADAIAIHRRHGVAPNPLYLRGATRVGCWPCIMAGKSELRLLAKDEPRIAVMERLEEMVGVLATERHERKEAAAGKPVPSAFRIPAFFQGNRPNALGKFECVPIRKHVAWALTERGGKALDESHRQQSLLGMDDGCLRWGMCESPG